ncbi:hypothetical protein Ocin01_16728 [Orchesella cincta]|uniref:Uncharacterized protein n=1 Tax=Orchesella cincta TaxID=48709 RepID=A0A1D2MAQ6_ORCCI|nr:hypothetical protein Ocin01_16728 [Orchesella cincta]
MNYNPERYHRQWELIRAIGMFILFLVILSKSWRSYSYSRKIENDNTWDGKDFTNCLQVDHNPTTDRLECKRYGSGDYFFLGTSIFCIVVITLCLGFILKRVCYQIHKSRKESTLRLECALEFAVIANSPMIANTSCTNSNVTELEPAVVLHNDEPPPEYIPPPAYNDCVINMRDHDTG